MNESDRETIGQQMAYLAEMVRKSTASDAALIVIADGGRGSSSCTAIANPMDPEMVFRLLRAAVTSAEITCKNLSKGHMRMHIEVNGVITPVPEYFALASSVVEGFQQ